MAITVYLTKCSAMKGKLTEQLVCSQWLNMNGNVPYKGKLSYKNVKQMKYIRNRNLKLVAMGT
jgi:hypothetical protein